MSSSQRRSAGCRTLADRAPRLVWTEKVRLVERVLTDLRAWQGARLRRASSHDGEEHQPVRIEAEVELFRVLHSPQDGRQLLEMRNTETWREDARAFMFGEKP